VLILKSLRSMYALQFGQRLEEDELLTV